MFSNIFNGSNKNANSFGISLLAEIEEDNIKNEFFFKQIENWKNVEQKYIMKVTEIATSLRQKGHKVHKKEVAKLTAEGDARSCSKLQEHQPFEACMQFSKILQLFIDGHKSFLSKLNFDIFMVNFQNAEKMLSLSKKLLDEYKQQQKDILSKRQQIDKIVQKKDKLKKQKEEEEMVQIFISDSFDATLDLKIRKKSKIKQVQIELQSFELKIKEVVEEYKLLTEKQREIQSKLKQTSKDFARSKEETLLKIRLHLGTYWKNLLQQLQNLAHFQQHTCTCYHDFIFQRLQHPQDDVIKRLSIDKPSFVQNSLILINQNLIDELIEYSKDRQVKNKIKKLMESDEVNPVETDETCRQVKLIKKILSQQCIVQQCMNIFKTIVRKSSKHRMNFVFVMQFYRLNNQFEMASSQIYPLHCLISEFLQACYQNRDSFVIKQMMILLMTYYVTHNGPNGESTKLYIIHFFKKNPMWKEIEYWQSVLLECIYLEKKNTINAMIVGSFGNLHKKKELLEGQRAAILNQMLIVVRNMIIFDYTEKEVKSFAARFVKLLKQDQKFLKDVYNTIEDAVKEETKLHSQQKQQIKQFYKQNFDVTKPQSYSLPVNVRRSYIA